MASSKQFEKRNTYKAIHDDTKQRLLMLVYVTIIIITNEILVDLGIYRHENRIEVDVQCIRIQHTESVYS